MKIITVLSIFRAQYFVLIVDVASSRRGAVILDQIFKPDLAFTETITTTTIKPTKVMRNTVDRNIAEVKGDTIDGDTLSNESPINVQIFYPAQNPLTTTRSQKNPPSSYPIIQIFNYPMTPETTTTVNTTDLTTNALPFRFIPLTTYSDSTQKNSVKPAKNLLNDSYDSLIRSLLSFLPVGTTADTVSLKQTTALQTTTSSCPSKKPQRNKNCSENDSVYDTDEDDDDDEEEDKDYSESKIVIFRPFPQGPYSSNSYSQYYGGLPYYGNLPFSGVAPYSYHSNPNCRLPYIVSYWECIRTAATPQPTIVRRPQKPRTKSRSTTKTTIATTIETTTPENPHPYFQLIPLLLAQQQLQTTTEAPSTKVPPIQLPYIHIIQLPNLAYGNGENSITTPISTPITTMQSTTMTVTTTVFPTLSTANSNPSIESSSIDPKSLNITILPSNMQCFAVNPECRSIMRTWTRMIPYSSVTRWTKRYWELSTVTTPTVTATGAKRTTPKRRRTTEFYYDYSEIDNPIISFGRCNVTVLNAEDAQLVNIFLYTSTGWIVFWALLLLIVNSIYREFGAHRWLDTYQEFGFVVIYIFMGIFVLKPVNRALCTATTMILLFFLVLNLSVAFMQTFWLSSLIKGSSERNGRLPILVNYVWPVILATAVMLTSYFTQRANYASTQVHCFCELFSPLYWTFTLTAWTLWFMVLVRNQVAVTACRQSRAAVDAAQLYWAKKSCKATPILVSWFLMSFFALMFAVDLQLLWLCVTYTVLATIFGPLLFYFHTQNHIRSNNGLAARTYLGLYRVCSLKRQKLLAAAPGNGGATRGNGGGGSPAARHLHRSHSIENPNPASHRHPPTPPPLSIVGHRRQSAPSSVSGEPSPAPTVNAPPAAALSTAGRGAVGGASPTSSNMLSRPTNDAGTAPTSAQVFYDWLMDRNEGNIHESENVLFRPPRPI